MEKEYTDDKIGDLEGDDGVDPMCVNENEAEDEQDYYDYGSLSDGEEATPSMMS